MKTLRSMIKTAAYSIAPKTTTAVASARARAYSQRLVKDWGLYDLNAWLIQTFGSSVMSGPFKGLLLSSMAQQEHLGPYLLGTYEIELHQWWEEIFRVEFAQVVDIGAKFGYYAVGLARQFPHARIDAIDPDWWARDAIEEMVAKNSVSNVRIHRYCDLHWLRQHLQQDALLISDCEGYEHELFCGPHIPALVSATMIIELHETFSPGVSSDISRRFSGTHVIQQVASRADTPLPAIPPHSLTDDQMRRGSTEVRPSQTWVCLRPRR